MSDLAQNINKLSPAKRALLLQRLREQKELVAQGGVPMTTPIQRQSREAGYAPLSFAQQRVWFIAQLEEEAPVYILPMAFVITGPFDSAALVHGLNELVYRHESLRTRFVVREGHAVQLIDPPYSLHMPHINLTALAEDERAEAVRRLAREEAQRPFDLACGPLVRTHLIHLATDTYVLILSLHHIIADGWSLSIFFRELSQLYAASRAGHAVQLPEMSLQYADYALWQRDWLQGEVLHRQLAYWRKQLADLPHLALPTDFPRSSVQRFQGGYYRFHLSTVLTLALKQLSQQAGVTLFMTLLAAFSGLLARYSGQEDIAVGTPIANRARSEVQDMIGLLVNTLVLRCDLSDDPTVHQMLERVRHMTLEAYAHQDLPFEKLVEELRPERSLSANPLFQVLFALQNAPAHSLALPDVVVRPVETEHHSSILDLTLNLAEGPNGLYGGIEYDRDLFHAETIERFSGHYQQLLAAMVAFPSQRLSTLPLLTEAERVQQYLWNATEAAYPQDTCLQELFEAQVARTSDAVALQCNDQQLTYHELNRRANQLAHYLRRLEVGPEVRVGLCVERTPDMVVGLLGILKAGGAYVPLDPDYPSQRLAFMLADAQADDHPLTTRSLGKTHTSVLVTQHTLRHRLPTQDATLVCLDVEREDIATESSDNPSGRTFAQNLAYVIYTSGSTGKPKGVAISHRAIVNFLTSMQQRPGLAASDTVLALTSLSFDIAGLEIFLPLLLGARLEVASREIAIDALQLVDALTRSGITFAQATPSAWHTLVQVNWPGKGDMKLLCGGEALAPDLACQLLKRSASLWNMYGPTETTIWSALHHIETVARPIPSVPIGRPIANTQLYVLDTHCELVPCGVAGELYIGGVGLSRGYLHRPELTAEKFIPNPFSTLPGERLYRTGDLARSLSDGSIAYLSRSDSQIKLHGYRIELGEIEAALRQHPAVQDAVVLLREDRPGDRRLVAYIVGTDHAVAHHSPDSAENVQWQFNTPTLAELRTLLQRTLPDYMLPAIYVPLQQLPLTPNGKLDRKALPTPISNRLQVEEEYAAPRTAIEETLAGLWMETLGVESVGIHDNFFVLGGDSILSLQFTARARQVGIALTPRHIFRHQTIAQLATVATFAVLTTPSLVEQQPPSVGVLSETVLPTGRYTPSSFPLLDIDQEELDEMLMQFAQTQEGQ